VLQLLTVVVEHVPGVHPFSMDSMGPVAHRSVSPFHSYTLCI
jgi:hypothetical protein